MVPPAGVMASLGKASGVGAAARHAAAQESAPSAFQCLLEEQPTFLVPKRLVGEKVYRHETSLVLNPECWFSWSGAPPAETSQWLETFAATAGGRNTVWSSDAATGALLPFCVGPSARRLLEDAAPGEPPRREIEPRLLEVLRCARVLVVPDEERRRREQWSAIVESARKQFEQGYVPLAGLIHPYHVGALRRYYRRQIRTGAFRLGDDQSALRHVAHNEPVARFFHSQLAGIMSQVAGEQVKPSYVYFASYQGGAELEKHTDREQCEFSITYCVDYTPEPDSATDWPIHLDVPPSIVTVYQAIGDALLYRGCRVPHSRKRLWRCATSSSIFFHFVRKDFSGPLN
jgi:hypothetical protein